MNVRQVKELWRLETLLNHLGHEPDAKKSKAQDLWYKSPFRPGEQDASFHINRTRDIWKDFGEVTDNGGDLIAFVQALLKHQGRTGSVQEALEWFRGISGNQSRVMPAKRSQQPLKEKKEGFKLLSAKPIFSKALWDYVANRGICREIAEKFLVQVYFVHRETGRKVYGVGMLNRAVGYEVRNPLGFKGVVGQKEITVIESGQKTGTVEVFEGMFDFLSRMQMYADEGKSWPEHDCIILHSGNMYGSGAGVIRDKGYTKALLWLDNDVAGQGCAKALAEELADYPQVEFEAQNHLYAGYKDVSGWFTAANPIKD